ncbi:hypothetical protein BC834DRAFT_239316 [Gloeopeniophorella convolvens]|nr:hypothetical protein BC834DRAFT_239316 [Gloeopeniophorella convolvens]
MRAVWIPLVLGPVQLTGAANITPCSLALLITFGPPDWLAGSSPTSAAIQPIQSSSNEASKLASLTPQQPCLSSRPNLTYSTAAQVSQNLVLHTYTVDVSDGGSAS